MTSKSHSGNSRSGMRCGPYGHIVFALIAIVMVSYPACTYSADSTADSAQSMFSFSGFGTLGVVHSSVNNADFTSSIYKPNGAGYTHNWSPDVDSLIGAQLTANITPKLSAVVQAISEQNYDNTYRPHVEWANIKYQFTPDFSVRVGRTVLPAFLVSDTREVGYTYPWVRPPLQLYGLLPVTFSDGLDVSYRLHVGDLTNTVRAVVGGANKKLVNNDGTASARRDLSIVNTTESGPWTTYVSYQRTNLTIASLNSLFDAFRQFGPQGVAIADRYNSNGKPFWLLGIGAEYDVNDWFVMSEWATADFHSFIGKKTGWYASGGYRFRNFTPYVTYAQAKADNLSDPGLTVSALPPFLAGPATGLNAALNSILSTKPVQNTVSVGTRWDFMKNMDLKLQVDHSRIGAGSSGELSNIQAGFQLGSNFTLFTAAVNFVF